MGASCNICVAVPTEYITGGKVINLNFVEEEGKNPKKISIHDLNTLRKAIELYQEQINKSGLKIRKAIYEPNQTKLPLDSKLNELDINFFDNIIVYIR